MSPRLGVSFDVFGNGKLKAYASYGRYYDWVKYEDRPRQPLAATCGMSTIVRSTPPMSIR